MRPYFHLPACVTDELGEMTQNNVGVVPGRQRSGRALSRWDQHRDRVTHTAPPRVLNTGCQTFLGLARQKYVEVGGIRQGPQLNRPKNPKFFNSLIYPFQDLNIQKLSWPPPQWSPILSITMSGTQLGLEPDLASCHMDTDPGEMEALSPPLDTLHQGWSYLLSSQQSAPRTCIMWT